MKFRQIIISAFVSLSLVGFGGCRNKTAGESSALPLPNELSASTALPAYSPESATALLSGSIRFHGKPDELKPPRIGGSRFCVVNKGFITNEDALVTSDGKLQNVIVYIRSGLERKSYPVPQEPILLDQQHCIYVPHVLTIMTNQNLVVKNSDDTFHSVHATPAVNAVVNLAQPVIGMENTVIFDHAEMPFRIGCDLHRWMGSWVGVFDHPFHTTSGKTGTYKLRLPPGTYEVVAWHEKYGERSMNVEIAERSEKELDFSFQAADGG